MVALILKTAGWVLVAAAAVTVGYALYEISRIFTGYYVGGEKGFIWAIGGFLIVISIPFGLLGRALIRQGRNASEPGD